MYIGHFIVPAFQDDDSDETEDDDDIPLRAKARKNATKATKKAARKSSLPMISQLLGKRRCAAEANERIARVHQQETNSGNSSGNESSNPERTTRSGRVVTKRKEPASNSVTSNSSTSTSSSGARSKRRRAIDEEIYSVFNPTVLEDLLNDMMKHRDGWPFDRPITKADAPDYHTIVSKPMDLGTIRSGINRMKYTCNQEVVEDIQLVFKNCWLYNREEAEEYQCGLRLEKYFKKEAKRLNLMMDDEDEEEEDAPKNKRGRRTL